MVIGGYYGKLLDMEEDLQCFVCLEIFENFIFIFCGYM